MPKILVTGGAGYIGSITTLHLLRRGFEVAVIDDLSRGHRENVPPECLHVLRLQDTDGVTKLLAGVDAVVHFAAYIAVGESTREPELNFSNNVGGTVSLLEAMARAGVRRLVFSSTAAVYGNPEHVPIPEEARFAPVSPYGQSKAIVEKILGELDHYRGLRSVALRYFNACGAEPQDKLGEAHHPETHLIPLLLRAASTGEPIQIFGDDYPTADGTCIRDYIHVWDLVRAHCDALAYLRTGGTSVTLNCGYGRGFSVREVIDTVKRVAGTDFQVELAGRRPGDPAQIVAAADRARSMLAWQPQFDDLQTIVTHALAWERKLQATNGRPRSPVGTDSA
jgi:UDP-glucose-4-epimerase GalE